MIAEKEDEMKETSFEIGQKETWFWKGNQVYIICPFFETIAILLMQKTSRELGTDTVSASKIFPPSNTTIKLAFLAQVVMAADFATTSFGAPKPTDIAVKGDAPRSAPPPPVTSENEDSEFLKFQEGQ